MLKTKIIKKINSLNWKQRILLTCYFEIRNKKRRKLKLGKIAFFYHPPFSNKTLVYGLWEMRYVNQPFADREKKKILKLLDFIELEPVKVIFFFLVLGLFIILFYPPKIVLLGTSLFHFFFPKFFNLFVVIFFFYSYPITFIGFFL